MTLSVALRGESRARVECPSTSFDEVLKSSFRSGIEANLMDIIYQDSYILAVNKPAIIIHSDTSRAGERAACVPRTLTSRPRLS